MTEVDDRVWAGLVEICGSDAAAVALWEAMPARNEQYATALEIRLRAGGLPRKATLNALAWLVAYRVARHGDSGWKMDKQWLRPTEGHIEIDRGPEIDPALWGRLVDGYSEPKVRKLWEVLTALYYVRLSHILFATGLDRQEVKSMLTALGVDGIVDTNSRGWKLTARWQLPETRDEALAQGDLSAATD